MIMAGKDITSTIDVLKKTEIQRLYHSLVNPKPEIDAKIRQLRILAQLNPKLYSAQKRTLPYFVCGTFTPPYRRTENFAYTETFVLDIDKLSYKFLIPNELKQKIITDPRILLCFESPSGDGLKIIFRLKERCYDPGLYSIFYKAFAREFSLTYNLSQVIDSKTSDVTRACFISVDPNAFYNPQCTPIDIHSYIDETNTSALFEQKHQNQVYEKLQPQGENKEEKTTDPDKAIIEQIKQRLNPKIKAKVEKQVFVPKELNDIIESICQYINSTGLVVTEVVNIQYAKQIRVSMNIKRAEVNLCYGRKGFTVVKSTKNGTNDELNDVLAELVETFILNL